MRECPPDGNVSFQNFILKPDSYFSSSFASSTLTVSNASSASDASSSRSLISLSSDRRSNSSVATSRFSFAVASFFLFLFQQRIGFLLFLFCFLHTLNCAGNHLLQMIRRKFGFSPSLFLVLRRLKPVPRVLGCWIVFCTVD